jgi:dTDP-glucose pyrophosphorylase
MTSKLTNPDQNVDNNLNNLLILPDVTISEAMIAMNRSSVKCLIVIDSSQILIGTLSDGDIRKSLLKGKTIKDKVKDIYNDQPMYFREGTFTSQEVKKTLLEKKLNLAPVVDGNLRVIDVLFWEEIFRNDVSVNRIQRIEAPVIIMAGGKGIRLEPFTHVLPKPLVPIKGKTVIEHIIDSFVACGVKDFYLTVNHKSRIIKAYFEDLQPSYKVSFIDEKKPLGTGGSLKYMKGKIKETFIVTNCDIIINMEYAGLLQFHKSRECTVTLVASTKNFVVPYGTCELNKEGYLVQINEKPEYNFLANTGLYVLEPNVLEFIPPDRVYHITHLIEEVISRGMKVGVYPVSEEAWLDVGQWSEFKKTIEFFENINK